MNIFRKNVLEDNVGLAAKLIGARGAKTPAGVRDRGDPAGALATRRLPEPP